MMNCYYRGFGSFQSFINSNKKTWNHKVQKSKIWGISR